MLLASYVSYGHVSTGNNDAVVLRFANLLRLVLAVHTLKFSSVSPKHGRACFVLKMKTLLTMHTSVCKANVQNVAYEIYRAVHVR